MAEGAHLLVMALAAGIVSSSAATRSALAVPPPSVQEATARKIAEDAVREYGLGHYLGAALLFEKAHALLEQAGLVAPDLLYNAAVSYDLAGECDRSAMLISRFALLEEKAPTMPDFKAELARTQTCAPLVRVVSDPKGARISVDGAQLGFATPTEIHLKRGTNHVIGFELEGYESASVTVTIEGTSPPAVEARLVPARKDPTLVVTEPPASAPPLRPWMWASLGLGAAALAVSGVLYGLGSIEAANQRKCGMNLNGDCTSIESDREERVSKNLVYSSWVTASVGGAACIAGLVLFLTGPEKSEAPAYSFVIQGRTLATTVRF